VTREGADVNDDRNRDGARDGGTTLKLVVSYTIVGVPLLYGLIATAAKASQLFTG
jgi:hypothetical protein